MDCDFSEFISNSNSSKEFQENFETNNNSVDISFLPDVILSMNTDNKDSIMFKVCSVCGDKALGFNFGAITCESCKAFFRRNALKKKVPPCVFEQHCQITVNTRKFCTFCRLMKCFETKMRKESIIGESSKPKRTKYNNNCRMKTDLSIASEISSFDNDYSQSSSAEKYCYDLNTKESFTLQCIHQRPRKHRYVETNSSNPYFNLTTNSLNPEICKEHNQTWSPTLITSVLKNSKLVSLNDKLSREGQARLMGQEEWDSLFGIYKSYIDSFIESGSMPPSAIENVSLSNLVNSSGFIVRKLINFAKGQLEFTSLEQPSQITLLKGAVLNSLILRSAVEYDVNKKSWITPQGEISLDLIKAAGLFELYDDYAKYCTTLKELIGNDNYLISLMQILCLFCYDNSTLTDRQMVSDIHDKYMLLLKHYLEASYGFTESRYRNVSILNNIIELYRLTSKHGQILLHVDPTNVDPLMLEVFNMSLTNSLKNSN